MEKNSNFSLAKFHSKHSGLLWVKQRRPISLTELLRVNKFNFMVITQEYHDKDMHHF